MPTTPQSQPFYSSATFNAVTGLYVATIRAQGYWQILRRLSIVGPPNVGSVFSLYLNGIDPSMLIDTTNRGDLNTNQYQPPEPIPPGSQIVGTWTGGIAGLPVSMTAYLIRQEP